MSLHDSASTSRLLVHSLLPSAISLLICLLAGFLMVASHTLSLSTSGIAYPNSTNDTFMLFYANNVVQPLASTFNNGVFNNSVAVILWGACGLVVYTLIAGAAGALARWRETEHDVSVPQEGVVVRHPLEHSLVVRGAWRLLIIVLTVAVSLAFLPLIRWCLINDERLLHSSSIGGAVWTAMITITAWMLIFHCYLIFIRLYMFRTRVFGELLY